MKNAFPALLLATLFAPAAASACSCPPMTDEQFAKQADNIYFAILQEAKLIEGGGKRWPSIEGHFLVRQTLKGRAPSQPIKLGTSADSAACGQSMLVGASYVLFMRKDDTGMSSCDGSRIVERFQEEEFAAKVKAALGKGATR